MASTPSTPEPSSSRPPAINRSFTVSGKLETVPATKPGPEIGASEGIETLYYHPSTKVVQFTRSAAAGSSGSGKSPAKIPWSSPTERTLAAGPLQIYRVPGSAVFLRSGSLLQAIMRRSQCWCVDGVSKFAMPVMLNTYYRIDLPAENEQDRALVAKIKDVLKEVLIFEKTPCPFVRPFDVDVPDGVQEDWARKARRRRTDGPAKKWRRDRAGGRWTPEDGWPDGTEDSTGSSAQSSRVGSDEERDDQRDDSLADGEGEEDEAQGRTSDHGTGPSFSTPTTIRALSAATRRVTAPPQLSFRSTPPSKTKETRQTDGTADATAVESSASNRSAPGALHTFQAIPTDMPPSPPDSSAGLDPSECAFRQARADGAQDVNPHLVESEGGDTSEQRAIASSTAHTDTTAEMDEPARPIDTESGITGVRNAPSGMPSTSRTDSERDVGPIEQTLAPRDDSSPPPNARSALAELVEAAALTTSSEQPTRLDDPYAAIQARIRQRRTLSTRLSTTSLNRQASMTSSSSSDSSGSSGIRRQQQRRTIPDDRNVAAALVAKACSAFLGPPARLVAIMLRIAHRLTENAFAAVFVESPAGSRRRIPGRYFFSEDSDTDGDADNDQDDDDDLDSDNEDDFGVPLRRRDRTFLVTADREDGSDSLASKRTSWSVD